MNLSRDKKYSPFERELFVKLRRQPKPTTIITDEIWEDRKPKKRPDYARQSVVGALDNLLKKVARNREPFRIKKSPRKGPHPVDYWIEKR